MDDGTGRISERGSRTYNAQLTVDFDVRLFGEIMMISQMKRHSRIVTTTLTVVCPALMLALLFCASSVRANNYVNWKGGFWFALPDHWEQVNYALVDRYLSMMDTSKDIYNYEAVFAPATSQIFTQDAYLVVTFDSLGPLTTKQSDSVLTTIAETYSSVIEEAPIVNYMSDLRPGHPKVDRAKKVVSVISEMAYQPEALHKLWLYMQLNDSGLISMYFYSPDSTFKQNMSTFEEIVNSLSFTGLREASSEELTFTDVGAGKQAAGTSESSSGEGGTSSSSGSFIPYIALILIILYLLWRFAIAPRLRKKKNLPE
jgi:hypothetical protein